jgi:hypothetical protein
VRITGGATQAVLRLFTLYSGVLAGPFNHQALKSVHASIFSCRLKTGCYTYLGASVAARAAYSNVVIVVGAVQSGVQVNRHLPLPDDTFEMV